MSEYKFTQDWFAWAPKVWEQFKPVLPARKSFLEIGSYEGRSTVWTIENMMEDGGEIVAIDTWEGGEEHAVIGEPMSVVAANFEHNMNIVREKHPERKIVKCKGLSSSWLATLNQEGMQFDFIYIDGSHIAKDVLTDACMAFPLLKPQGIIVFDDYMWGDPRDILHRPKIAIDSFINVFAEHIEVMAMGYQLAIRKK
jgi:predicted O-methyltransferase YrrM